MRVGVILGRSGGFGDTLDALHSQYERAARANLSSVWLTQFLGFDALTIFAAWGRADGGPELGTAVIPIPSRHPLVLAQHALTTQATTGGRLALGIGLGHRRTLDETWGLATPRSIDFLSDYLSILSPLLAGEGAEPNETFPLKASLLMQLPMPDRPPPLLVAALGPRMLTIAGQRTEGTITWMTGPRTVATHIVPTIVDAAERSGRTRPRVVVCLPLSVTNDVTGAREWFATKYAGYARIPSYARMLEREGVVQPGDVAIVGDERATTEALGRLSDGGATDIVVMLEHVLPPDLERTWTFLESVQGPLRSRTGPPL